MSSYLAIKEAIEKKVQEVGRDKNSVTLVAVSKGASVEAIKEAYHAGARYFGENRLEEFLKKKAELPKDINWHMIGTIQTKKAGSVVDMFSLIHSVDTLKLAEKLDQKSSEKGVRTSILLQVNTSCETSKHGFTREELLLAWDTLEKFKHLSLMGLMTMAPFTEDQEVIRNCFSSLRRLKDDLEKRGTPLKHLSMGMSHDWPIAIEEGATLLRIGSRIFTKN